MSLSPEQQVKEAVGKTEALMNYRRIDPQLASRLLFSEIRDERVNLGSERYSQYQQQLTSKYDGNPQISAMLSNEFALVQNLNIRDKEIDPDLYVWKDKQGNK